MWLGDNFSEEKFMKLSVSGIMQMGMSGIPLVGADICGFLGETNEDLCTRWHYLGAFYPFSRNHNGGSEPQEPYVFNKTAMQAMTHAIKIKYSMIRYYYTELFMLSLKGEGTFYKPLFFEFPEDPKASNTTIEFNIMLGSALKLSINSENITVPATQYYFPSGVWCLLSGNTGTENCFNAPAEGSLKEYPSGLTDYQLHIREGYIVPM
jgi:alpha-glucosidase (family GH31 glycosyl hydrolase)